MANDKLSIPERMNFKYRLDSKTGKKQYLFFMNKKSGINYMLYNFMPGPDWSVGDIEIWKDDEWQKYGYADAEATAKNIMVCAYLVGDCNHLIEE